MRGADIQWTGNRHGGEEGRVGSFPLFTIDWVVSGGYMLRTRLPLTSRRLRLYPTPAEAQEAADHIWQAFITRVTTTEEKQP